MSNLESGVFMKKNIIPVLLFIISYTCFSQDFDKSILQKINEDIYEIDEIIINKKTVEISFPVEFNMEKGVIEYMLCGKFGKLHESILKTSIEPSYLQVALLLLGFECGQNLDFQRQEKIPKGDSIDIYIEWFDSLNVKKTFRIEELASISQTNITMNITHWTFLGSKLIEGVFQADNDESIISVCHDPYAIIDIPLQTGSKLFYYKVNSKIVPLKGTKAKITIKKTN